MSPARPAGYHDVVRRNWQRTTGYLLAASDPCIAIRDEETRNVRRRLKAIGMADVPSVSVRGSWVLGVIVCPGDDLAPFAAWAKRRRIDGRRVWFFLHRRAEPELLRPWKDAGFRTDQVDFVSSWRSLHPLFGLALNDQVYSDFHDA